MSKSQLDRDHWLHHLSERCEHTSLKPIVRPVVRPVVRPMPRWTPYRQLWHWDPEQVDDDPIDVRWVGKYSKLFVVGCVILGVLVWKTSSQSNAGVPEVLAGGAAKQTIASADVRSSFHREQQRQVRPDNYDLLRFPVNMTTEKHWRNLLWTTAIVQPTEPFVRDSLDQLLGMMVRSNLSPSQTRTVEMATQVGTQLYLANPTFYSAFSQRFIAAIAQGTNPQWVAVSLSNIARAGASPTDLQLLVKQIKTRFPRWASNVHLRTSIRDVDEGLSPLPLPPLGDLLRWEIAPKQLHLYVICQPDRDVLCRTVLKDRNGEFVRHQDGQLWSVPLLLRSIHKLAWNFSRGQTPQGIYRVEGSVPQPDDEFFRAFGQFSLVNLYVPFEPGTQQFLPGKAGPFTAGIETYQNLLPPSWRGVWAMQQTYWAGKAGRGLFRIHGTGDAPDFFSSKSKIPESYNWNPTIGCLSALELYNEKGQLLDAHMPKILKALETVAGPKFTGYLVVVDVPGEPGEPIALEQVNQAITQPVSRERPKSFGSVKESGKQPARPLAKPTANLATKPGTNLPVVSTETRSAINPVQSPL